jgi:RNA polymerase sigma factor (sigma-70 family)
MESGADYLRDHRFKALFNEVLGWDRGTGTIRVSAGSREFVFESVAQKRGLQVLYSCTDNLALVNRGLLRKVQRIVARSCHEHILIFCCDLPRKQVWQWAIRLPDGRKLRHREHPFFSHCPPEPFVKRLGGLRFTLNEEETVTLVDALERVRGVLDTSANRNGFVRRPWYAERSAELIQAMKAGNVESLHRFLVLHLPLARFISKRLCRWFGMLPEDAEQIGFLGLVEAARRFRPELGCQFSTYATPWVKQVCQRFGPDFAFLIHLPDYVFWPCFRLRLTLEHMVSEVGSAGLHKYLTELDIRDPRAGRQLRDFERATAIRSLSDRKQPEYRAARQIVKLWPSPLDDARLAELAKRVQMAVSRLRPREAQIIRLRYGFDGCPSQTLEEIGQLFSVTRERVRQIQSRAEERLRGLLSDEFPEQQLLDVPAEPAAIARLDVGGPCPSTDGTVDGADLQFGRFTIQAQKQVLRKLVARMPDDL